VTTDREVQLDSTTRAVREPDGVRLYQNEPRGRRARKSATAYETNAAALAALIRDEVRWGPWK
jgi:hypothetical protein